jgi:hypothetical protein
MASSALLIVLAVAPLTATRSVHLRPERSLAAMAGADRLLERVVLRQRMQVGSRAGYLYASGEHV